MPDRLLFNESNKLMHEGTINQDFKQLLDNLSTAVLVADEKLHLIYLNGACENVLQVSLNHVHGRSIQSFYYESDDAMEKARQTLKNDSLYTKRKASWRLHNNKSITVDYTVTPMKERQQVLFEIQQLDRLLQISREEALIASQNTSRHFIRGLAHEVKNPLGGILGAAQLLQREISDQEELNEYTGIIISEADRLRNLVDRMMGPRRPIDIKPMKIHDVTERVITLIKAETEGRIAVKRDYDPSIPELMGDLDQLIQAFLNIVRNSVQALESDPSIKQPQICFRTRIQHKSTIGCKHHALVCTVTISDNGPGIPKSIFDNIFYPMISGRAEGTGLGLSISQQLINQHNGLIECTSEPGKTQFLVYLPLELNS
ncbi:MAG: two-component system nitrogen regulation sensor histidine kinase GlnL [Cellvibrionaceae bacterium]|jgi:two-component system nitrogen regulation sensor histidine kinase GlnL